MDPAQPGTLRSLLRQYGIHPRKRLGQHFLCDGNILARIAEEAERAGPLPVVEIGAGCGALTVRLAARAPRVVAIEVDPSLLPILTAVVGHLANVRVVRDDFLRMDTRTVLAEAFGTEQGVVVGNIPYGITAPILERVFDCCDQLARVVLLVQTEVAERLTARPATPQYGSLTVFASFYGHVQRILRVPRHLFYPAPEVGSTLIAFQPDTALARQVHDPATFFRVVRAAFGQRRKTLANALAAVGFGENTAEASSLLRACGVDPLRRGETLSPEEFVLLANHLVGYGGSAA